MDLKNKSKCFLGIIIYFGLMIGTTILVSAFVTPLNLKNPILISLANLIAPLLTLLVIVIIYKDAFKNKFNDFRKNSKKYTKIMIKCYFLGFLTMAISNIILSSITGNIAINEEQNRTLVNSLPLYSIIATIFFAPITEELTFRYPFCNFSSNKNICALISCIFFGFAHVIFNGDYIFIIPYAGFGFFLAKAYLDTDNIITSIGIHMFHNALCIITILLGGLV